MLGFVVTQTPVVCNQQETEVCLKFHSVLSRDFNFNLVEKAILIINKNNNIELIISGRSDGQTMIKDALIC